MNIRTIFCQIVVYAASVGIVLPQLSYGVEANSGRSAEAARVRDVALNAPGDLHGMVVDSNGKPVPQRRVVLLQNGELAGQAATDSAGAFVVAGLRPGVYEVATDSAAGVFRVWSRPSAPPAANDAVLLVDEEHVVRGQPHKWRNALLVTGLVIAAGVIGGVIGYNLKDDDDAS